MAVAGGERERSSDAGSMSRELQELEQAVLQMQGLKRHMQVASLFLAGLLLFFSWNIARRKRGDMDVCGLGVLLTLENVETDGSLLTYYAGDLVVDRG